MAVITEIHGYVEDDQYNIEFKAGGEVFVIQDVPINRVPGLGYTFTKSRYDDSYILEIVPERSYRVALRSRLTDFILLEEILEKDDDE